MEPKLEELHREDKVNDFFCILRGFFRGDPNFYANFFPLGYVVAIIEKF